MMRVAFVTGGVPLGGSTTYMLFLAGAMRRLGVPAEVFSFSAGHPLAKDFEMAGVPVHRVDKRRLTYEDRLQQLYSRLRVFKPTAVFAVLGPESFEMLRYLPKNVARIGVFHDRAIQPAIFGARYRETLDHVVVVAAYLRDDLLQADPQFPCTYLAHGIPLPKGGLSRTKPDASAPLRLLFYGRFDNVSKGVRLFPEIAAALKRRQIPFCWTIHGCGPEEEFLKAALADDVLAGRVRFSAPVSYDQLPQLVRQHDVYLLSSINEGGPLTLLESMALGLVPVCGDIPCLVQEVITTANGFRVPRHDPDAYSQAIARLHADRGLLEQMSSAARATISSDFSDEAMARRYVSLLESHSWSSPDVTWGEKIRVRPILGAHPFYFGAGMKWLRRVWKKRPQLSSVAP